MVTHGSPLAVLSLLTTAGSLLRRDAKTHGLEPHILIRVIFRAIVFIGNLSSSRPGLFYLAYWVCGQVKGSVHPKICMENYVTISEEKIQNIS